MKFGFIAKHRTVWPVAWLCEALGVSRSGFHAWLKRAPNARSRMDEALWTCNGFVPVTYLIMPPWPRMRAD